MRFPFYTGTHHVPRMTLLSFITADIPDLSGHPVAATLKDISPAANHPLHIPPRLNARVILQHPPPTLLVNSTMMEYSFASKKSSTAASSDNSPSSLQYPHH